MAAPRRNRLARRAGNPAELMPLAWRIPSPETTDVPHRPTSIQPLGGLAPEPLDVAVVGLVRGAEAGAFDGLNRPLVEPALDFGVAVGEGETAGSVVVAGRQVRHDRLREIRGWLHVGAEEPVVDAVGMLINKDPGVGGLHEVGVL